MSRRALFLSVLAILLVEITSCGGSHPITVAVTDGGVTTVAANGTVSFFATVMHSSNQNVTWAVSGGAANGTITSAGVYTAPAIVPNPAMVTITATSQANTSAMGQASITVTLSVSVSPTTAIVQTLGTTPFSAIVNGSANQSVTWQVNGIAGGSISTGTITANGVFQAPESVPENASTGMTTTVMIQAVPQANPTLSASATVTVTSPNQLGQNVPVKLGTSGGNVNNVNSTECASGTLGSLVVRKGAQFILSNNHVLADSDAGHLGDGISQPGLIDAPSPCLTGGTTTVGNLSQFIMLEQPANCKSNCMPPADAAIAQVVSNTVDTNGTIIELGDTAPGGIPADEAPSSTVLPVASLVPNTTAVAKSGRSTGLTCSIVEATGLTVQVQYNRGLGGPSFTATYINQVSITGGNFSAAGDSGSLIVSQAGAQPVALLYAGSATNTVGAPAADVLADLGDTNNPPNFPTFVGTANHAVAGCTSSGTDAFNATAPSQTAEPSSAELSKAETVKNQNASALLSDSAVLAVGVANSLDRTSHAAIVVFVRAGQTLVSAIPHNLGGVPTRIVRVNWISRTGALDHESTVAFVKSAGAPAPANPAADELAAAKSVKDKFAPSLMKEPGILGVGVTSSLDNPSEAAIMIYVETGKPHNAIPLELDGVRVRVKYTDKFRAYGWGPAHPHRTVFPRTVAAARPAN